MEEMDTMDGRDGGLATVRSGAWWCDGASREAGGHFVGRIAAPVHQGPPTGIVRRSQRQTPPPALSEGHPPGGLIGGRARRDNAGSGRRGESEWGNKNGAPGAIRTHDFLLLRQALYPLSYGRAGCAW